MPLDFPTFRPGQKITDISARQLNNLVEAVRALHDLSAGEGLTVNVSGGRTTILRPPDEKGYTLPDRTVVLVEPPDGTVPYLTVRTVEYASRPPIPPSPDEAGAGGAAAAVQTRIEPLGGASPGAVSPTGPRRGGDTRPTEPVEPPQQIRDLAPQPGYRWASDRYRAWPDFGYVATDYSSFYFDDQGGQRAPDLDTPFLKARFYRGSWLIEQPSAATSWTVVREVVNDGDNFVRVQSVDVMLTGGVLTFAASGPLQDMMVQPHLIARDYRPFVTDDGFDPQGNPMPLTQRSTNILPALRVSGVWWILQHLRFDLITPRPDLDYTDCVGALLP